GPGHGGGAGGGGWGGGGNGGGLGGSGVWGGVYGFGGRTAPRVDLVAERRLVDFLVAGAERALFRSAHDCSQGGLGVALAEVAMGGPYDEAGLGLEIDLTAYGARLAAVDLDRKSVV